MAVTRYIHLAGPSGSLGGTVFSRNRAGSYIRVRAIPVNPNTPFQQLVKSIMGMLSAVWVEILTDAQRDSWNSYALNVLMPNRIGELINVGGLGMFQRSNIPRLQTELTGLTEVDQAPTIFDLGSYTHPDFAAPSEATQDVAVSFTATDDWVGEDGAAMLLYGSRPQNPSINYFQGPYRLMGAIEGDGTTPPTSPATLNLPFTVAAGHRVFFRATVSRVDGRLSSQFQDVTVAAA